MYIIETIEFDACKIRRLKQAFLLDLRLPEKNALFIFPSWFINVAVLVYQTLILREWLGSN